MNPYANQAYNQPSGFSSPQQPQYANNARGGYATYNQPSQVSPYGGSPYNQNPQPSTGYYPQTASPIQGQLANRYPGGQAKTAYSPEVEVGGRPYEDHSDFNRLVGDQEDGYGANGGSMPKGMQGLGAACTFLLYSIGCAFALVVLFVNICRLVLIPIATFRHDDYFLNEIKHTGRVGLAIWIMSLIAFVVGCVSLCFLSKQGYSTVGSINGCSQLAVFVLEIIYTITMLTYWDRFKEVTGDSSLFSWFMTYCISTLALHSLALLILACYCCCGVALGVSAGLSNRGA